MAKKSSLNNLYGTAGTRKEIDLRAEFIKTFEGSQQEISKKQPCLIRDMRKDANGNKISCPCVHPDTKEPEKERLCPFCLGEGYLWDEKPSFLYKLLKTPKEVQFAPGLTNVPLVIFYMRHDADIEEDDKLIQLVLDDEGKIVQPVQRKNVFNIQNVEELRLDTARLEFKKITTFKEDVKFLNE